MRLYYKVFNVFYCIVFYQTNLDILQNLGDVSNVTSKIIETFVYLKGST